MTHLPRELLYLMACAIVGLVIVPGAISAMIAHPDIGTLRTWKAFYGLVGPDGMATSIVIAPYLIFLWVRGTVRNIVNAR
jgi:hypothetical protein